jgi:hypothetical protein
MQLMQRYKVNQSLLGFEIVVKVLEGQGHIDVSR